MAAPLWVYVDDRRVGHLSGDASTLRFTYDSNDSTQVSVRMPPRREPYEDAECRPFFANLLPEATWRAALCRQFGIAAENDFALLAAIGADCAGAVSLRPEADWTPERGTYVETTEAELRKWVKNPAARPALRATPGLRLSLAGAQDKLLIHFDANTPYLCEGGSPSTVILKPDIHDSHGQLELTALNELFTMRLAHHAGLVVPRAFWFASAYAVERYDRAPAGSRIRRLHQEDLAQVLGRPPAAKYDVGWKECFAALSEYTTAPAAARVELVDRLLFNLMVGNADAHAKNFSLLHEPGGARLAPAYDLVCTAAYPSLSAEFAMDIGQAKTVKDLSRAVWTSFSHEVGLSLPFVRQRALLLTAKMSDVMDAVLAELTRELPGLRRDVYPARRRSDLCDAIVKIARRNCRIVARSFE